MATRKKKSVSVPVEAPVVVPRYCLRTTDANGVAYGGFRWPKTVGARVECRRWDPSPVCGDGLHGDMRGQQSGKFFSSEADALWWVVEPEGEVIEFEGKCKFRSCFVRFIGTGPEAVAWMRENGCPSIHWVAAVDADNMIGGYASTLTGGDASTLTGGYASTLTGGNRSTLTGGYASTLTGGDASTLTGGDASTLTGGYASTLTGGDASTLTGGDDSTLTGGDRGTVAWKWWDSSANRYRITIAYVGEDGIEAGVAYRFKDGAIHRVEKLAEGGGPVG